MIAYITPSPTMVPVDKFIDALKGSIQGFERSKVESVFQKVGNGDRRVSLSAIQQSINSDEYPELVEGFNAYGAAYCMNGDEMSVDEFIQFFNDMFLASQELYHHAMGSMWRI